MVVGWIYFRLWFYPIYLIKEIWYQAQATGHPSAQGVVRILTVFLIGLAFLNLFWFYQMISGLLRRMKDSKETRKNKVYNKIE